MTKPWYKLLIDKIEGTYSELVIVADGDGLGRDGAVRRALEKHFVLHDYQGELPLRVFLAEKDDWQRAIIFSSSEVDYIPYDLENSACMVSWRLKGIFPKLDIAILKEFPAKHYQKIYESYSAVEGSLEEAGTTETLHIICQWLFGTNLARIVNFNQAVALLATVFKKMRYLPPTLRDFLKGKDFGLNDGIWEHRDVFFGWLSEQWELYLDNMAGRYSPSLVEFTEPCLRELVAGLFIEGYMEPYRQPDNKTFEQQLAANPWLQAGVVMEKSPPTTEECGELLQQITAMLAADTINWCELAYLWGRYSYLRDLEELALLDDEQLDGKVSKMFELYVLNNYKDLFYSSYQEHPVTVDQVMHFLGNRPGERKALLCMDGMGFQEWFCIKEYLKNRGLNKFKEGAVFALLPTITSVSRRALFCGQKEMDKLVPERKGFIEHIDTYWREGKRARKEVFLNAPLEWDPVYGDYDYLGAVFNLVDDIAHSRHVEQGGKRLMQLVLNAQLGESNLLAIVTNLLEKGFLVYITADHGILSCHGNGFRADKHLVDTRARRALVYPNRLLADDFACGKDVLIYRQASILGHRVLVVPKGREMFATEGNIAITHGGMHIEELIIPFVEVLS